MRLSKLRVEQFKQFRSGIELDHLDPGLNLFTGPNEAGKSTLVAAIRAAFFERHRSSNVDDLRPWGESGVAPTVMLEFELEGRFYRLTKSFLARKRCELLIDGERFEGDDAEERIKDLLGFQQPSRGASKAEHWGIPGLLWIRQGDAQEIRPAVEHATDQLRGALERSLGEVAASGGDELISRVEALRLELLTAATGKPRGEFERALKQRDALSTQLAELDEQISRYRQRVDELARLRAEHQRDQREAPSRALRERLEAAEDQLRQAHERQRRLADERLRAGQIEARIRLLRERLESFAAQRLAVDERRQALTLSTQALTSANAELTAWRGRLEQVDRARRLSRDRLRQARQQASRAQLTQRIERLDDELDQRQRRLVQVETAGQRARKLTELRGSSAIEASEVEALRAEQARLRELEIERRAAATLLDFSLDEHGRIELDGEALEGQGERRLLGPATLRLPGLGTLRITPGGANLSSLGARHRELSELHAERLARLGVDSLHRAEARLIEQRELDSEARALEATLAALAPAGVEALREEYAARRQERETLIRTLAELTTEAREPALDIAAVEAEDERLDGELREVDQALRQAQLRASRAQVQCDIDERELATAQAALEAPERTARLDAGHREEAEANAELATQLARIEALERKLEADQPEILAQDVERLKRSVQQHERRFAERREAMTRLEVELESLGAQGLEERRAELARDLAQLTRRCDELERRARALDLLLERLRDKRQRLTQRLQAPLVHHLERYLRLLLPEARLELDEGLAPVSLTRPGAHGVEHGDFDQLSFGAREQMGVISRLAYADLLKEAGRPTLLILDDALVHADESRLAQMKRVLFDAATRHQLLIFSCHPEAWADLGVAERRIPDLVHAGQDASRRY